ncbi:MAG: helix-turn-helix domain-containing protein, partial [Hungatella sp.]
MVLQSLDRGLDALNILAKHDLVSVTELAKELEVDKSTASRIMETLRQHDMV